MTTNVEKWDSLLSQCRLSDLSVTFSEMILEWSSISHMFFSVFFFFFFLFVFLLSFFPTLLHTAHFDRLPWQTQKEKIEKKTNPLTVIIFLFPRKCEKKITVTVELYWLEH